MAASTDDMAASMIANLKAKTGKDLNAWIKIAAASQLEKHGQLVKFLKTEHGLGHGYANLVAHKLLKSDAGSAQETDLVAAQYTGPKAPLRSIYDRLISRINALGNDVNIAPKRAYVSLRRNKQFGLIQPSTKTRVDVGINLKGRPAGDRLEASGSFNSMVSHRVRLAAPEDVDDQLVGWLRDAYEQA